MADILIRPGTGTLSIGGNIPRLNFNMLSAVTKTPGTAVLTILGKSLSVVQLIGGAFTWRASTARLHKKPKVDTAYFGEGYEQRQAQGLNSNLPSWDVSFANLPLSEGDALEAYLDQSNSVTAFQWTPPNKTVQGKYICEGFDRDFDPKRDGVSTITATFREVLA